MMTALRGLCLLSVMVMANVVTVAILMGGPRASQATGPVVGQCVAGDANGDGSVDVSDPVWLLSYIFDNGPEPVACAQEDPLSDEIAEALAQFMPRHRDFEVFKGQGSGLQTEVLLTVPAGKRFIVTLTAGSVQYLVNGEVVGFSWTSLVSGSSSASTVGAVVYPLLPGDVLSVELPSSSWSYRVHGYWADE